MSSICAECGSQVLDLKSHLKIHKDSKVECEVCGKVLTNRKAFRNHMQTHKSWSCPRCQIVIPHNSRTMHLKKCMKEEQKEFNCEECAYVTTKKLILFDFSVNFEYLFENFNLNMTLKVHIILHHYKDYFDMTQKSMRFTNGEFVESTHYSIKNEERTHNFKVKRMMGTPIHLEKSKKSLVWHNSRRLGMTPPEKLRLRRSVHSPINI